MNNLASPWKRLVAFIIDGLLTMVLGLYIFSFVAGSSEISMIMNNLLIFIIYLFIGGTLWTLVNTILTSKLGGSIGKLITGLTIVNHEGNNISFWRAVLRNYVGYYISSLVVWLGFIWVWKNKEHQGWHDMIANTYVIEKNKSGIFLGSVILLIAIFSSFYLLFSIVKSTTQNISLYTDIITDIKTEFEPTPTPDKLLQMMIDEE